MRTGDLADEWPRAASQGCIGLQEREKSTEKYTGVNGRLHMVCLLTGFA